MCPPNTLAESCCPAARLWRGCPTSFTQVVEQQSLMQQAEYELARLACECTAENWASIKSAGRQGVLRAYKEGGARKARVKLEKMRVASLRQAAASASLVEASSSSSTRAKKRRRRANARERRIQNKCVRRVWMKPEISFDVCLVRVGYLLHCLL